MSGIPGHGELLRSGLEVRERLAAATAEQLGDAELVALILATGTAGTDALATAGELIRRFGDLHRLGRASLVELQAQPGVGPAKACRIQAALELGRRSLNRRIHPGESIRSSRQVVEAYTARLAHLDRERFIVLLLDAKHRKIKDHCVSIGCLDSTIVHPREVFRPAVAESAAAVILIHNHPSGDPTPSAEDHAVTRRLAQTAEVLGVELLDHVIVARQGSVSFRDEGQM